MDIGFPYLPQDITTAKTRCRRVLHGMPDPLPELKTDCIVSILVPVYDESIRRLREQIAAFASQRFPLQQLEIVYIVNNPVPKTDRQKEAFTANQKALTFLKQRHPITVHVIDRSSKGKEILECNVGKARNIGLHVVAARYLAQKRDGILIQTDADTYPMKASYLQGVVKELKQTNCFGAAGGIRFVLDVDSVDKKYREFFKTHVTLMRQYFAWGPLVTALHIKDLTPPVWGTRFSGAHMITRVIASVCAGGVPAIEVAEDFAFGAAVEKFAEKRNASILARRDTWILQTALRESIRAGLGMTSILDVLQMWGDKPLVRDPASPSFGRFLMNTESALTSTRGNRKKIARALEPLVNPKTTKERQTLRQFAALPSAETLDLKRKQQELLRKLYYIAYPRIVLTSAGFHALQRKVYADPKRKMLAKTNIKYLATFHLK